ncbi:hypothetical protein [Mycoplasma capricolum]|uniref:hypothetical protein n=1 Tax=Mycoplasma capricolum TaxID=2095 RepID=UPI0009B8E68D|nr:hypothetical protein [Mycoplasma capricolum]
MKKLVVILAAISVFSASGFSYVRYKNVHNQKSVINKHQNKIKRIEKQLKSINDDINIKENELKSLLLEDEKNLISSKDKINKLKQEQRDLVKKDLDQKQMISKLTKDLTNLKLESEIKKDQKIKLNLN